MDETKKFRSKQRKATMEKFTDPETKSKIAIHEDEAPKFRKVRYQNFCLVGTYAKRKGVSSQAVEKRIAKGEIIPIYIGTEQTRLIHWPTYKNLSFKTKQQNGTDSFDNTGK